MRKAKHAQAIESRSGGSSLTKAGHAVPARLESTIPQVPQAAGPVAMQLDRLVGEVVGLLAAVVSRLRTPLRILALAPVAAGAALVVVSALRGGPDVPFAIVLAIIGVTPGGWLAVRRRQLLGALQPPAAAAAEISAALAPADIWAQVKANLLRLPTAGGIRPGTLAKKMWRGVKLGAGLRSRLASTPRLAPFMPGRLRGAALLGGWCVASAVVLAGLTVIKALTALVGIG